MVDPASESMDDYKAASNNMCRAVKEAKHCCRLEQQLQQSDSKRLCTIMNYKALHTPL